MSEFEVTQGSDAKEPVRLLVVQEDQRPPVDLYDDEMVMTYPHLVVRELIAFVVLSVLLVVASLTFDAPLEALANPQETPNPSKAPWYFLGLQELLHYYPPLVSGVLLPGIVLLGLAIVPYFDINLKRSPFWTEHHLMKLLSVLLGTIGFSLLFYFTGSHPVWPLIAPTIFVGLVMLLPGVVKKKAGIFGWLGTRSLPFFCFVWFLLATVALTVIGVFFRGPGWAFTLPWVDGIYY